MDVHKGDGPGGGPVDAGRRDTVVARPLWSTVGIYVAFAAMGAVAGWLLGFLADWLVTLSWAPMQGPARLVASAPRAWLPVGGAALGLVVGLIGQYEQLALRVSDEGVVLTSRGRDQEFAREAVATAFRDGKRLVLLGHDGSELAREECDLDGGVVAAAFTGHGYAWADEDPLKGEFRRWVPDAPGLPEGANALLQARGRYLEKNGASDGDVRELRGELARLGVVVRDEKRRQYWRTLPR